ncbi:hypothetical protein OESDEN_00179 [Oesophagostomum dentatum]|uniref:glucuronosyltransferase n=1 Tax=Oesophagostomum dentatum TaxID=61180 RepID=A0A0B1TWK0_OESDE|nr:hypothetical protein OESDEN_00179 [Oesophagostomum dentatum]
MDNSRPLTSQWIQIGGLGSEKGATLNSHWSTVLSLRPRTIVVTFNKNTACHRSKEVLLPNPHVAAFITDGRLSSLHNAMSSGKPVICIPSDREQQRNCHQLRKRGVALVKDCWDLTVKDVKELLKQISEEDVRTAARSLSESVKSRAASSRERLTRTVEFAAKYGPAVNLHSSDEDVGLIQKHNMDVYIPFAILLATTALLLVWIARSICKKCIRGHDKDGRRDSHTDDTDLSKNTLTSPAPSVLLHPPKMRQDTSNEPPPINSDRRGLDAAYEREQSENE